MHFNKSKVLSYMILFLILFYTLMSNCLIVASASMSTEIPLVETAAATKTTIIPMSTQFMPTEKPTYVIDKTQEWRVNAIKEAIIKGTIKASETYFDVTEDERDLLARLVHCEANTESLECQKAVVSVIFNRLKDGTWGDSLEEVIFAKHQFTPATSGKIYNVEPTEQNYEAVDDVIQNGPTLPDNVKFFRADYHFKWENYVGYLVLDKTYFGYLK